MGIRILVLATGNIYVRRGVFNAVISRTKHLKEIVFLLLALILRGLNKWCSINSSVTVYGTPPFRDGCLKRCRSILCQRLDAVYLFL